MDKESTANMRFAAGTLMRRLRRDTGGNALAIVAASLAPLLAIIGSGVDLGRSYLSETRLQQACDSGVMAARKKLGAAVVATGAPPAAVATSGNQFFNLNFRNNSYGSANRSFTMTVEPDMSISGVATVDVPTTVMNLFGYTNVDVEVECSAKLNFTNTDIMMVLDTTGSMNEINPSDTVTRMTALRSVVTGFHNQLETGKGPGTRIRYGFVPYSTNVNVGHLLQDSWVVDDWNYQSREVDHTATRTITSTPSTDTTTVNVLPGAYTQTAEGASYPATYHPATSEMGSAWYTCDNPDPPDDAYNDSGWVVIDAGPPEKYRRTITGVNYWTYLSGTTCQVYAERFDNALIPWVSEFTRTTGTSVDSLVTDTYYNYAQLPKDVRSWKTETSGCMEERNTYEITDYDNVDLTQALDLDLDKVPTNDNERWRPMYPNIIYERSMDYYGGSGSFTVAPVVTTYDHYFKPSMYPALVACPAPARNLDEMDATQLTSYLGTISAAGSTYHDIGMIWGGRLISKTGLFAAQNADLTGKPTSRHLIFLTDGQTEAFDIAYGAYGVEPLDRRRWSPTSALSLNQTVEKRFGVACDEVKKRNVTVWVVGFGTSVSNLMKTCAGNGHWFRADDASQLTTVFERIAASMGDLRIAK